MHLVKSWRFPHLTEWLSEKVTDQYSSNAIFFFFKYQCIIIVHDYLKIFSLTYLSTNWLDPNWYTLFNLRVLFFTLLCMNSWTDWLFSNLVWQPVWEKENGEVRLDFLYIIEYDWFKKKIYLTLRWDTNRYKYSASKYTWE